MTKLKINISLPQNNNKSNDVSEHNETMIERESEREKESEWVIERGISYIHIKTHKDEEHPNKYVEK